MTRRDIGPLVALAAVVAGLLLGERAGGAPARFALGAGVGRPRRRVARRRHRRASSWPRSRSGLLGTAVMQRALDGLERNPLVAAAERGEPATLRGVLVSDPDGQRFGADALVRVDGVAPHRARPGHRHRRRPAPCPRRGRPRRAQRATSRRCRGTGFDARARWSHAVAILEGTEVLAFRAADAAASRSLPNHARELVLRRHDSHSNPTPAPCSPGFLLGDTRALPDDIAADYRAAGLSHLLAVSGANVAFVLLVFAPLLRRLSLLPRTTLAIAVVVSFAAATRFEPSVLRASALTSVTILTSFVGRPVSRVRGLVIAIVALLLVDPFLVHSVGFHLSCAASAGIALFAHPLARRLRGPALLREPLAVSIAAQLGVTPVLLLTFGSVPVISPVANLLAYPAAEALGVFGLAASVIGGVVPPIGITLAPVTTALLAWVTGVAHHTAGVGGEIDARGALVIGALGTLVLIGRRVGHPVWLKVVRESELR